MPRQTHRKIRAFLLSWRNAELIAALWLFLLLPLLGGGIYLLLPFVPENFRRGLAAVFGLLGSVTIIAFSMDWAKSGKDEDPAARKRTICRECGSVVPLSTGCLPILLIPAAGAIATLGLRAGARAWAGYDPGEGFLVFGWIGVSYLGFLILRPFDHADQCPKCGRPLHDPG